MKLKLWSIDIKVNFEHKVAVTFVFPTFKEKPISRNGLLRIMWI